MPFDLNFMELLSRFLVGAGIGFCIGLTGVGGGVLMLPALILLFRMDPVTAVGTASLYSFITKAGATWHHIKLRTIEWKVSFRFLVGAVPANMVVASWIVSRGADEAFNHSLKIFIVCLIVFSLGVMLLNSLIIRSGPALRREEHTLAHYLANLPNLQRGVNIIIGVCIGGLIGATSIGGGVLIVPTLIIVFGLSTSRTVGTSIFITVILNLITASIYGSGKQIDISMVLISALGSLTMVYYGSKLAVQLPDRLLKRVVFGLILLTALLMVVDVAR